MIPFSEGDRVQVTAGAMSGKIGTVEEPRHTIKSALVAFGGLPLEIPHAHLAPIAPTPKAK